ncbi:hypothetical protein [Pseudomonas atacamensis]
MKIGFSWLLQCLICARVKLSWLGALDVSCTALFDGLYDGLKLNAWIFDLINSGAVASLFSTPSRCFNHERNPFMTELNKDVMSAVERFSLIAQTNDFIAAQPVLRSRSASVGSSLPIDKDELNAAIMGSGIAGFDASMSKRSKRIVKNTYMYADLVALLKYPASNQKEQRYNEFMRLMKLAGWFAFSQPYNRYTATSQKLTMDNVVLSVLHTAVGAAVGQGQAALKVLSSVADATMDALKNEPQALTLFENNSKKAEGGNFCMSAASQDDEGGITLAIAAVQYLASAQPTKVLFVEWATSAVEIYNAGATMYMDEEDYAMVEPLIVKALTEQREKALSYEFGQSV